MLSSHTSTPFFTPRSLAQKRWKETLLRLIEEEEETITPDNKQLLDDLEEVRRLLRDDDSQRDEVRAYRKDKVFARLNVEKKIDDLRKFIVEEIHCT
jgi:predicted house-cleaning noncanonical NTP pyrophosphatase (MazG superfamily)